MHQVTPNEVCGATELLAEMGMRGFPRHQCPLPPSLAKKAIALEAQWRALERDIEEWLWTTTGEGR